MCILLYYWANKMTMIIIIELAGLVVDLPEQVGATVEFLLSLALSLLALRLARGRHLIEHQLPRPLTVLTRQHRLLRCTPVTTRDVNEASWA